MEDSNKYTYKFPYDLVIKAFWTKHEYITDPRETVEILDQHYHHKKLMTTRRFVITDFLTIVPVMFHKLIGTDRIVIVEKSVLDYSGPPSTWNYSDFADNQTMGTLGMNYTICTKYYPDPTNPEYTITESSTKVDLVSLPSAIKSIAEKFVINISRNEHIISHQRTEKKIMDAPSFYKIIDSPRKMYENSKHDKTTQKLN